MIAGPHKPRAPRLPRGPVGHGAGVPVQPARHPGEDVRGAVRPVGHAGRRAHVPAPAHAVHAGRRRRAPAAVPRAQVAAVPHTSAVWQLYSIYYKTFLYILHNMVFFRIKFKQLTTVKCLSNNVTPF